MEVKKKKKKNDGATYTYSSWYVVWKCYLPLDYNLYIKISMLYYVIVFQQHYLIVWKFSTVSKDQQEWKKKNPTKQTKKKEIRIWLFTVLNN